MSFQNGWLVVKTLHHFMNVESLRTSIPVTIKHFNQAWTLDDGIAAAHSRDGSTMSGPGGKLNQPEQIPLLNSILMGLGEEGWEVVSTTLLASDNQGTAETLWTFRREGRTFADDDDDPDKDRVHISPM